MRRWLNIIPGAMAAGAGGFGSMLSRTYDDWWILVVVVAAGLSGVMMGHGRIGE